ncbi:RDD family protein [Marinicella meishanensis]|uniref:RDD family protein n=1 Tax=Marinicella meishanensis TaxID=2873263 RepID=UPI001CBF3B88|nr:RDD family protein [Marinicella sp. NBU2979]
MEHLPLTLNGQSVYATFGQRLGAAIIDILIVIPIVIAVQAINSQTYGAEVAIEVLITVLSLSYAVALNYLYGGTIGKLVLGIRITHIDGSRISLKTSFMRSSVDILLSVVTVYVFVVTLQGLDLNAYFASNWIR